MKPLISLVMVSLVLLLCAAPAMAQNGSMESEKAHIEQQLKELGEELHKKLVESIRKLLDQEITRLRTGRNAVDQATRKQIENLESILKTNPDNAHAHFEIAELYDQLGDGASAIIHTHRAEQLYLAERDAKGVAEARRELRRYYRKYAFQPEDFTLPQ
ncbi:MAG: hypothetical protein JSU88_12680 [Nitrospinaceae bacterium]|jgi:cytochrome c-type biogenesis protein CcmH/NrfG|nr:MAG: hypothetical protein JSU88_12680 [Nitrospinaceae bacterium]